MASLLMMVGFAELHLRQERPSCTRHHRGANDGSDEPTCNVASRSHR